MHNMVYHRIPVKQYIQACAAQMHNIMPVEGTDFVMS